jgi:hypothetical protein
MIKVRYEFKGQQGELELHSLTNYQGKKEILDSIGTSVFEHTIIEDTLKQLAPDVAPTPEMYACERGGERNVISPSSEANRFGFSMLVAQIHDEIISIVA